MKQAFTSYITFTRTERYGLAGLCLLMLCTIITKALIANIPLPKPADNELKKLVAASAVYERSQQPDALYITVPDKATKPIKPINLNTATLTDLMSLPGVNEKMARGILEVRKNMGGKLNEEYDLLYVSGFGMKRIEKLKPYIFVK